MAQYPAVAWLQQGETVAGLGYWNYRFFLYRPTSNSLVPFSRCQVPLAHTRMTMCWPFMPAPSIRWRGGYLE